MGQPYRPGDPLEVLDPPATTQATPAHHGPDPPPYDAPPFNPYPLNAPPNPPLRYYHNIYPGEYHYEIDDDVLAPRPLSRRAPLDSQSSVYGLEIVGDAFKEISRAFADAMAARYELTGGGVPRALGRAFMEEVERKRGIVAVLHVCWVRRK